MTNQERILSNNALIDQAIVKANSLPNAGGGGDNSMLLDLIQGKYNWIRGEANEKSFVLNTPTTNITYNFREILSGVSLMDINTARLEDKSLPTGLKTLILRYNGVTTLDNSSTLSNTSMWDIDGDPECGGTIYVPEKYLRQYTSGTNWSAADNGSITWMTIEGSEYE